MTTILTSQKVAGVVLGLVNVDGNPEIFELGQATSGTLVTKNFASGGGAPIAIATTDTVLASVTFAALAGQTLAASGVATFTNLADVTSDYTLRIQLDGANSPAPSTSTETVAGVNSGSAATLAAGFAALTAGSHTVTLVATNAGGAANGQAPANSAFLTTERLGP